jgi:uncharacterized protein YceK
MDGTMIRLLVFLALLSGCTSINYTEGPVPGLENMTVEEHHVDTTEIYQRCSRCGKLGMELPTACTCINFRTNHAIIWLANDASQATIEHERAHARGYDHQTGELRDQYAAWTKRGGKRMAPAVAQASRAEASLTQVSELRTVTGPK